MVTKSTVDSVVLSAYGKVLGITPTRFSSSDDFICLGGNSLKSLEVAAELKQAYPALEITAQDVLRCRTASGLTDFIKQQKVG